MEIIRKENVKGEIPAKRGKSTKLRIGLLQLEVGDELFLPKEEWTSKTAPYYVVARLKKTHGFRYRYYFRLDGKGWQFRRVV